MEFGTENVRSTGTGYIVPPVEDEEIYPYARVWPGLAAMAGTLFGVVVAVVVISAVVDPPRNIWSPLGVLLALLPGLLWCLFPWLAERRAELGRERLFAVFIISALLANALGYPLIQHWLAVDSWGAQQPLFTRILIYSLAIGTIPEVLKYLVVRYVAWQDYFRIRADATAYSIAATIGYLTVLHLHYVLEASPPPDTAAIRIFSTTAIALSNSLIVAYGISEMRFSMPSPLLLPGVISIASLISGVVFAVRGNLSNTRLTLAVSTPRLLISLIISAVLLMGISLAMVFLFNTTERQAEEAQGTGL